MEFHYTATNSQGKIVYGNISGANSEEAVALIEAKGFRRIQVRSAHPGESQWSKVFGHVSPVSLQELALTSRQLAVMLEAGIGIQQALEMLTRQPLGRRLRQAWQSIHEDIHNGSYLSQGLHKHRAIFGNLYVGMARAGEASGNLSGNLKRVADYLEAEYLLRGRIRAALTYPAVVFVICVGIAVLIVQHILPNFLNTLFKDLNVELPWMTRVLIEITAFFNNPQSLALAGGILFTCAWMLRNHLRTPSGKRQFEQIALHTPGLRELMSKILTCRVARTMSTLLHSALLASNCLEITSEAVDHYVMQDYLKTAGQDLQDGHSLSLAFRAIPIFPPVFPTFVALGEESGRVPEMMEKVAELFEQDVEDALVAFTQLLEPVMVAVMGVMVGFVLIAIFVPLYRVLGSF